MDLWECVTQLINVSPSALSYLFPLCRPPQVTAFSWPHLALCTSQKCRRKTLCPPTAASRSTSTAERLARAMEPGSLLWVGTAHRFLSLWSLIVAFFFSFILEKTYKTAVSSVSGLCAKLSITSANISRVATPSSWQWYLIFLMSFLANMLNTSISQNVKLLIVAFLL